MFFIPRLPTCLQIVCVNLFHSMVGVLVLVALAYLACLWNRSVANRLKLHILYNCPCPPSTWSFGNIFLRGPKPPRGTWLPYRTNQHHQHHQIYSPLRISQYSSHTDLPWSSTTPSSFSLYLPLPLGLKLLVWAFVCSLACFRWSGGWLMFVDCFLVRYTSHPFFTIIHFSMYHVIFVSMICLGGFFVGCVFCASRKM